MPVGAPRVHHQVYPIRFHHLRSRREVLVEEMVSNQRSLHAGWANLHRLIPSFAHKLHMGPKKLGPYGRTGPRLARSLPVMGTGAPPRESALWRVVLVWRGHIDDYGYGPSLITDEETTSWRARMQWFAFALSSSMGSLFTDYLYSSPWRRRMVVP